MRAIVERESHAHEQGGPGKLERVNAPRGSTTAARGCSASKPVRATRSQAHSYAVCSEATRLWRVTSAIAAPGPSAQSAPRVELLDRLTSRSRWPRGRVVRTDGRQRDRPTELRATDRLELDRRLTILTWHFSPFLLRRRWPCRAQPGRRPPGAAAAPAWRTLTLRACVYQQGRFAPRAPWRRSPLARLAEAPGGGL
jgi:hypothetical protein